MSANLMELTRSTSPGSPATPNGVTVEDAVSPAAPQVLDAAAAAAASRLTPAPTTAAMATHLRRVLGVGEGAAVAPAAARAEAVSPRDMAARVRDIMSPCGGEGGGAGAGGGSSTGKSTGKSGKSPMPSRKRPRSHINTQSSEAPRGFAANKMAANKNRRAHKIIEEKGSDIDFFSRRSLTTGIRPYARCHAHKIRA